MMLVAGKISGIQQFLFATSEAGGGQAKRLRARSFIISLLAEIAALRVLRALGWPTDDAHYVLHGAGKFLLSGDTEHEAMNVLAGERRYICNWLAQHANGELQFALAAGSSAGNRLYAYRDVHERLHATRARPWAPEPNAVWDPTRLVLEPLDTPCSLCRRARATEDERDEDTGELRRVCRWCGATRRLGRQLPRGHWLVIQDHVAEGDLDLLGYGVTVLSTDPASRRDGVIALVNLQRPEQRPDWCPVDRFLERRLMAYVPVGGDGSPLEFVEIARNARGDSLLGVLVADADSLGVAIETSLAEQGDLSGLTHLSYALDAFFTGYIKTAIESENRWREIYTVFSGGDDLVMVGPWDVMFAFAGELRRWFADTFQKHGLTLSAGLALIKPKRPIKAAVAEAERLLEAAKTKAGPGESVPKDQCAAFGQVWKWQNHQTIQETALKLVGWLEAGQMERGWLHTLLGLVEARHPVGLSGSPARRSPDLLATARLAHHVSRNYRRGSEARRWAEDLVRRFDDSSRPGVRFLPAALRYALTATRSTSDRE